MITSFVATNDWIFRALNVSFAGLICCLSGCLIAFLIIFGCFVKGNECWMNSSCAISEFF